MVTLDQGSLGLIRRLALLGVLEAQLFDFRITIIHVCKAGVIADPEFFSS